MHSIYVPKDRPPWVFPLVKWAVRMSPALIGDRVYRRYYGESLFGDIMENH